MSANLIEVIRKKMGYPSVEKVDPVDHEAKNISNSSSRQKLAQAAIPAVLAVVYKFTRSEKGRDTILSGKKNGSWLDTMLENKEFAAVDKVAHYAGVGRDEAENEMQKIADVTITEVLNQSGKQPTQDKLKTYLANQRHSILVHLPPELQIGSLMEDDTLDDRTNKMEGPMSNFIHAVENKFSGGGS